MASETTTPYNTLTIPQHDSNIGSGPHSPTLVLTHVYHTQPPESEPRPPESKQPNDESPRSHIAPGFIDEGEKDAQGHMLEAGQEPCSACGGKIVWATKGEWLMICERCQEPQ